MENFIENIKTILDFINKYYKSNPKINTEKIDNFIQEINDILNNYDRHINPSEEIVKKILQFIFYYNLVVLKSKSAGSIRHYFPKEIPKEIPIAKTKGCQTLGLNKNLKIVEFDQQQMVDTTGNVTILPKSSPIKLIDTSSFPSISSIKKSLDQSIYSTNRFFKLLKEIFSIPEINIKIHIPNESGPINYFYINDYNSIIRFLLFWDNTNNFIPKRKSSSLSFDKFWSFKFPEEKVEDIQELFNRFDIFIYFNNDFINSLFGEFGIVKKNKISVEAFLASLNTASSYTRQAFYSWIRKGFIPLSFLMDLSNSSYEFDKDFYKYIDFIQIGKSSNKINKLLIHKIKEHYEDWFISFIPPPPGSKLGLIFGYDFKPEEKRFDILSEYETFLKKFSEETVNNNRDVIDKIKDLLRPSQVSVFIKSVTIINFKSYSSETFDFQRGINIIYGENGSGKTTLIEAILFALNILDEEYTIQIKNLFPLSYIYLNTHRILVGKEFCEVELKLVINNKNFTIKRVLYRNGINNIFINDENIYKSFNNINESDLPKLSDEIKKILAQKNTIITCVEDPVMDFYDIVIHYKKKGHDVDLGDNLITSYMKIYNDIIKSKYKEINCLFNKDEVYTLFYHDFNFLYYHEFYQDFYLKKFNLDYIDKLIEKLKNRRKSLIKSTAKHEEIVKSKIKRLIIPSILYTEINKNDYFELIEAGWECDNCKKEIRTIISRDLTGVICSNCGYVYCHECILLKENRKEYLCDRCKNKLYPEIFKRRQFALEEFFNLVNFDMDNIQIKSLRYINNRINSERFNINIKESVIEKLMLWINNPYMEYILDKLNNLINYSSSGEFNKQNSNINLKKIIEYNKMSNKFDSFKILNYFSLILINLFEDITIKLKNKKEPSDVTKKVKEICEELKNEKFILNYKSQSKEISKNDFYQFENRLLSLISNIFILIQSSLISDELKKHINFSENEDYIKFFIDSYEREEIQVEDLNLDYKIMISQFKYLFKLLVRIQLKNRYLGKLSAIEMKSIDDNIRFLEINKNFIFDSYIGFISKELKIISAEIFQKEKFFCFLDRDGLPLIRFSNSKENYPISILSGGERSKLILALINILMKITNKSGFFLIDEPNELLDPKNIELMKQYFFRFFKNTQLIISTFIETYKQFQPASIFEIRKDKDTLISKIENKYKN